MKKRNPAKFKLHPDIDLGKIRRDIMDKKIRFLLLVLNKDGKPINYAARESANTFIERSKDAACYLLWKDDPPRNISFDQITKEIEMASTMSATVVGNYA